MTANLTENQKLWVEELRSGRWRQADGYLKLEGEEGPAHCCLGVAAELSGRASMRQAGSVFHFSGTHYSDNHEYDTFPPYSVMEWILGREIPVEGTDYSSDKDPRIDLGPVAGLLMQGDKHSLSYNPGWNPGPIGSLTCAGLNDSGFTFNQIADMIEYFGVK